MYWTLSLFAIGVASVGLLPVLPEPGSVWWVMLAASICLVSPRTRPCFGLLIGICHALFAAQQWVDRKIPTRLEGETITVLVKMQSSPERRAETYRLTARVISGELAGRNLQLTWLAEEPPSAGEVWRFPVRLFRPRGVTNPGLFDYEAWLLSESIHGSGYVLPDIQAQRVSQAVISHSLSGWREAIAAELLRQMPDPQLRGLMSALIIGQSSELAPEIWETLSRTGTNHLFVVSGLHVGLVAGVLLTILTLVRAAMVWSLFLTAISLILYSQLVGFGLPVQRALIMALVGLVLVFSRREIAPWRILVLAIVLVLLINPFATLAAGFWLSFGAVAGLVFGFVGLQMRSASTHITLFKTQWVALCATAPLLLCWVWQVSLVSVIANLVAVPVVGLLLVPIVLAFLLSYACQQQWLSQLLLDLLAQLLELLFRFLNVLADLNWTFHDVLALDSKFLLMLCGTVIALAPRFFVPRWIALFCWLPLLPPVAGIPVTEVLVAEYLRVDVLDVGQGLSVVVTGPDSTLVYDTGPAAARRDSGKQIVLPRLRQLRRNQIDLLVVSHGDNDHAGGTHSLKQSLPVFESISSDGNFGEDCQLGERLYPDFTVTWFALETTTHASKNNRSCIVSIAHEYGTVLLPGDIEKQSELALIQRLGNADLMLSPHHGSRSSSSPAFINAVTPIWVVHSTGYRNRFNHPHQEVAARYTNRGIKQFDTAVGGAISFVFTKRGVEISEARSTHQRFWYDAASLFEDGD